MTTSTTTFTPGETALLVDPDGNAHAIHLREGLTLHSHLGAIAHDDVIGHPEGTRVRSSKGRAFVALRPRLVDFVFEGLTRKSGIVYPKDAAHLLAWADIAPGHRVLESGVGSGALTLALLRAVGDRGEVVGYEQRTDFIQLALQNVRAFTGSAVTANLLLRERDIYEGIVDSNFDRVVLDLPEPWRVLPHLRDGVLKQGGVICAYNPSIVQVMQMVEALDAEKRYVQVQVQEVLYRDWKVRGAAVRPEQQMVGHTGFLVFARLAAPELSGGT